MAEVFQHLSAESTKMEPTLRSTQVLKQEAEYIGLTGKEVAKYVREQQTLDREERSQKCYKKHYDKKPSRRPSMSGSRRPSTTDIASNSNKLILQGYTPWRVVWEPTTTE